MASKTYKVLIQGLKGIRKLVPDDINIYEIIGQHNDKDWYQSIFSYSQEHYDHLTRTKSLAGITDVTTDKLVWDFDDATNVEAARTDAKLLCSRLIEHGVSPENIELAFSGKKGFSVVLYTDKRFTPDEFKNVNLALANGLNTNDTVICDPQRIFRVMGTKHNSSDCYKFPLNLNQLTEMPVTEIQNLALDLSNADDSAGNATVIALPDSIYKMRTTTTTDKVEVKLIDNVDELDFKFKPRGFTNCKFAIMNGFFPSGSRSNSLMALASTCKAQGYPKDVTYNICKASIRLQSQRYGQEPFPKEELWTNIIEQVYKDTWKGGQFSCKKEPWLRDFCATLGKFKCNQHSESEKMFIRVEDMSTQFEDFSDNIEKNTIKTGIAALDDNVQLTIGMPVALLGAPSSGKTSLSLEILNNTSKLGLSSAFFSMDMFGPLVYQKQIQKKFGYSQQKVHEIFRHDPKHKAEINAAIKEEYKNVNFSLKAGHSVQDMRDIITEQEQQSGEKVKLVLIDYLECISGPYSDATANTQKIAGELRDFATEMATCVITLVQPPKSAGDASSPLTSMRQIKGSSMLEQSFRVILGIYREGFGPRYSEYDKFLTINALKNTMGPLFSVENYWNGLKGEILPIDEDGLMELAELRKRIKEEKNNDQANSNSW